MSDSRSYDETNLMPLRPTSLEWARTWVRQFLRDYPEARTGGLPGIGQPVRVAELVWPEFSLSDVAIDAMLTLDAVLITVNSLPVKSYRPHFTAARLYLGDPNLWRTRAVDASSETRRDPNEIILAWLNQGRAFDALINAVLPPFETVTPSGTGATYAPRVAYRRTVL